MPQGDVYLHSRFHFSDCTYGRKYLVVLNEPASDEPYLVVKTTSQLRKQYKPGCNPEHRVFLVQPGPGIPFSTDTLMQFQEVFPFSPADFLRGSLEDREIEFKGRLPELTVRQVLNCVARPEIANDIPQKYYQMIRRQSKAVRKS